MFIISASLLRQLQHGITAHNTYYVEITMQTE